MGSRFPDPRLRVFQQRDSESRNRGRHFVLLQCRHHAECLHAQTGNLARQRPGNQSGNHAGACFASPSKHPKLVVFRQPGPRLRKRSPCGLALCPERDLRILPKWPRELSQPELQVGFVENRQPLRR